MIQLKWQRIESDWFNVSRAKIYGGWLVTVEGFAGPNTPQVTFVPDPSHLWHVDNYDARNHDADDIKFIRDTKEATSAGNRLNSYLSNATSDIIGKL